MITAEQKIKLEEYKPNNWIDLLSKLLLKRKVVNKNNKPYPGQMLAMVYSGKRQNAEIEAAIMYVFLKEKKAVIKRNQQLGITTTKTA